MCFQWRERRGLPKMSEKQKQSLKLHATGEYHISFQSSNMQQIESLTEKWREMASLLGNIQKISKLHTDVRANELNIIVKRF